MIQQKLKDFKQNDIFSEINFVQIYQESVEAFFSAKKITLPCCGSEVTNDVIRPVSYKKDNNEKRIIKYGTYKRKLNFIDVWLTRQSNNKIVAHVKEFSLNIQRVACLSDGCRDTGRAPKTHALFFDIFVPYCRITVQGAIALFYYYSYSKKSVGAIAAEIGIDESVLRYCIKWVKKYFPHIFDTPKIMKYNLRKVAKDIANKLINEYDYCYDKCIKLLKRSLFRNRHSPPNSMYLIPDTIEIFNYQHM